MFIFLFLSAELELLDKHFQLLAALPAATRSSLLQHITKVMEDPEAVSSLESVVCRTGRIIMLKIWRKQHESLFLVTVVVSSLLQLDQMCLNKSSSLAELATTDSQKENIQAIVGLLEQSAQGDQDTAVLKALHLVAGAMDGEEAVL